MSWSPGLGAGPLLDLLTLRPSPQGGDTSDRVGAGLCRRVTPSHTAEEAVISCAPGVGLTCSAEQMVFICSTARRPRAATAAAPELTASRRIIEPGVAIRGTKHWSQAPRLRTPGRRPVQEGFGDPLRSRGFCAQWALHTASPGVARPELGHCRSAATDMRLGPDLPSSRGPGEPGRPCPSFPPRVTLWLPTPLALGLTNLSASLLPITCCRHSELPVLSLAPRCVAPVICPAEERLPRSEE